MDADRDSGQDSLLWELPLRIMQCAGVENDPDAAIRAMLECVQLHAGTQVAAMLVETGGVRRHYVVTTPGGER
ncbi:MAG: hypothetical protein ACOCVM_09270, partial [Desulfovibrionaceae bacterium]